MLTQNDINLAFGIQKKMHAALCELQDLTQELSTVAQRRDDVSMRMFLSMRQEQINLLLEYEKTLDKQCRALGKEKSAMLKRIFSGEKENTAEFEELEQQVARNKELLLRVQKQDEQISRKIAGPKSIYAK